MVGRLFHKQDWRFDFCATVDDTSASANTSPLVVMTSAGFAFTLFATSTLDSYLSTPASLVTGFLVKASIWFSQIDLQIFLHRRLSRCGYFPMI